MPKLNIHLTLDEKALRYCREVNAGIRKITESVIKFDDESPMIPHISLFMGELDTNYTVSQLASILKETISGVNPIEFRVLPPYIENVRNRYVFSDVEGNTTFDPLRRKISQALGSKVLHGEIDYTQTSHLTLGHVEDKHEEINRYLANIKADFTFKSNSVEISGVGPKGTCLDSLYIFEL